MAMVSKEDRAALSRAAANVESTMDAPDAAHEVFDRALDYLVSEQRRVAAKLAQDLEVERGILDAIVCKRESD